MRIKRPASFLLRAARNIVIVIGVLFLAAWIVVARPIWPSGNNSHPAPPADLVANLERHVRHLSTEFVPRDFGHPENLDRAAGYIREAWEEMGFTVEEQIYDVEGKDFTNVIIKLGPENSNQPPIIIGAHYDVMGIYPGADDNASGTAGLIELARILKAAPPSRPVILAAYTLEEPPIYRSDKMGSYVHAKSLFDSQQDIDIMISLEMIGYFDDTPNSQDFPVKLLGLFYPNRGNFIGVIDQLKSRRGTELKKIMRRNMNLPVHSINGPKELPGIDFSDHRSYWNFGYDAVMVTDTSFYRNKAYHTEADTADRLSYAKMADVVLGVAAYAGRP